MSYYRQILKLTLCLGCATFIYVATDAQTTLPNIGRPNTEAVVAEGTISGKIMQGNNEPATYATVTLLTNDSSVVSGDLSNDKGEFKIQSVPAGKYLLRIETIGSVTKFKALTQETGSTNSKLGIIKLSTDQKVLKAASVIGEKAGMEIKVDKKVFNVEKNITTAGGSATDVLQNVPSVSVDGDGNVSLRGKSGVTILIDGKPATMLGSDVASALSSMPASSIENVEVITNPSSKYDAQGNTGIINIITKKDGRLGINGNITLGAGTRDKYNGNFGLNFRKGKLTAFINSGFRLNSTFNNVFTDRYDNPTTSGPQYSYKTYEHVPRAFNGSFNTAGLTYDFNKNNSITITENFNFNKFEFKDYSTYTVYPNVNQTGNGIYHQNRTSEFFGRPNSISSAVDFRHKFKKKDEELNIDATYAVTEMKRGQYFYTVADSGDQNIPFYPIVQSAPGSGGNSSFNAWADYTNPLFTKNGKLSVGAKTQYFSFNSQNSATTDSNGRPSVVDSNLRIIYEYTQQINAAYVNWSDQLNKFSYQLGLRVEDATYRGTYENRSKADVSNNFRNLFPTVFFSYQLNPNNAIMLNYSRRTNRPGFMQLLPYLDLSNPSAVSTGNPGLLPEFINSVELSYNTSNKKGSNIVGSIYYQYTENLIERINRPGTGQFSDRIFIRPENIASGTTYGVEAITNLKFNKSLDATLSGNVFRNEIIIGNDNSSFAQYFSNISGLGYFGKGNINYKFPKEFSVQLTANYESEKVLAQGSVRYTAWGDIAVKKSFMKNKAVVTVNCHDVFKTHRFINDYVLTAYNQTTNRVKETRIGHLTFTYRFGKTEFGKNFAGEGKGRGRRNMESKPKTEPQGNEDRGKNLKEGDDNDQGGQNNMNSNNGKNK